MVIDDLNYFRNRAAVEREQARRAASPEANCAHRQLAAAYMRRIGEVSEREQRHV